MTAMIAKADYPGRLVGQGKLEDVAGDAQSISDFLTWAQAEVKKWKFTKNTFEMSHQMYRGFKQTELALLEEHWRTNGKTKQAKLLKEVVLLGDGMSSTIVALDTEKQKQKSFIVTAKRQDGKYDILTCECLQMKDWKDTAVNAAVSGCLGTAVGTGAIVALATGGIGFPVVLATGSVLAISGAVCTIKATTENNTQMVDMASAFMLTELVESGILELNSVGHLTLKDAIESVSESGKSSRII